MRIALLIGLIIISLSGPVSCGEKGNPVYSNTITYAVVSGSGNWTGRMNDYVNGKTINEPLEIKNTNSYIYSFTVPSRSNIDLYIEAEPVQTGDSIIINIYVGSDLVATNHPRTSYEVHYIFN
ncbi:MAG: hypothetical protein M3N30_14070 [Bacteroidota bacterium]|jgi:hypothetical protein|nr:hypothetical protein [Bacteroidota bacterium]